MADLSSLINRPVKFRFYLTNGKLYSFWVSANTSGASNGYVAAGGPGFTTAVDTAGAGVYGSVAPTVSSSQLTYAINAASLDPGTYTAQIDITDGGAANSPSSIPVTVTVTAPPLYLSVSPATLTFTALQGGANPAAQSVAIANLGNGSLGWTATSNQTWLTASPSNGTAPSNVSVGVSTAGLAAGTYNGTVTVTAPGAPNSPKTIAVTLNVAAVSPASLTFNGAGTQTVTVTGLTGWTATSSQPWLTITPSANSFTATASTNGLAGGTYTATITVGPLTIPVTLNVPAVSPSSLTFNGAGTQTVTVTGLTNWTATSDQPWLTITPSANSFTATASTTGLAGGTYSATITVGPLTIPVTLNVPSVSPSSLTFNGAGTQAVTVTGLSNWTATSNQPWLTITPSANSLTATASTTGLAGGTYTATITVGPLTIPVTLNVAAVSPASLTFNGAGTQTVTVTGLSNWTATSTQPWLTITPSTNSFTATASTTGLAGGTYTATITVGPLAIPVTLNVPAVSPSALTFNGSGTQTVTVTGLTNWTATSDQPWLTITPSANSFTATASTTGLAGGTYTATITVGPLTMSVTLNVPAVSPTSLTFNGAGTQTVTVTGLSNWTATSNQRWLTITPSSNSFTATASTTGLAGGTYTATVTVGSLTIPVTLNVPAVTPTSLTFNGPGSQTVTVTGLTNWTATSDQPWLTITPSTDSFAATVSTTDLAAGTYIATITVGPLTVPVTLTF
ncbi:MAG: hypothetical protein U0Q16_07150 [Bryobacteraceae bacterium]